jgi:hypothetical protein
MKNDNYINYVLVGLGVIGVWYYLKNRNNKPTPITEEQIVTAVVKEEEDKYSTPFVNEYKIVMPSDLISKRLKEKSEQLRAGRFAIKSERVKDRLFI